MLNITDTLVRALSSARHDAEEVRRRLEGSDQDKQRPILAAVRAEDEDRFWESTRVLLDHMDWQGKVDFSRVNLPFELLAAHDFRTHGCLEHACDHFCWSSSTSA